MGCKLEQKDEGQRYIYPCNHSCRELKEDVDRPKMKYFEEHYRVMIKTTQPHNRDCQCIKNLAILTRESRRQ